MNCGETSSPSWMMTDGRYSQTSCPVTLGHLNLRRIPDSGRPTMYQDHVSPTIPRM